MALVRSRPERSVLESGELPLKSPCRFEAEQLLPGRRWFGTQLAWSSNPCFRPADNERQHLHGCERTSRVSVTVGRFLGRRRPWHERSIPGAGCSGRGRILGGRHSLDERETVSDRLPPAA